MLSIFDLVAQTVNFIVLILVLTRVLYRPVLGVIEQRRKEIESRSREANLLLLEARQKNEVASRELDHLGERTKQIIDAAEERARRIEENTLERAREQAQGILQNAQQQVEQTVQQAADRFRQEAVDTVLRVSTALLSREVRQADHQRLLTEMVEDMGRRGEPKSAEQRRMH